VTVYLVGAGPGDPGLLTVRAAELLARADVVVYDPLLDASLLALAPPGALRVDVGEPSGGPMPQDEINALLVGHGRAGREVVRLEGGDPFVSGRGGEEAIALQGAGVAFEVVPGVTPAVAAPAYAGIPVIQPGRATSFTVVTGHDNDDVDWAALARTGGTIVVLTGVAGGADVEGSADIAARLLAGGLAADTPVASVTWGTRPEQRAVRTTLAALGDAPDSTPATIVVGAVAGLDLAWYTRRPLFGRSVVVTRASGQAPALSARLRALGARPVELPAIAIAGPADGGAALAAAATRRYDWVIFTSANAVPRFCDLIPDSRALAGTRIAAIGPSTAEALARYRLAADLVPDEYVAESLLAALLATSPPGHALVPRAAAARPVLSDGLRAAGWHVDVVEAYRTMRADPPAGALPAAAAADAICFTASSTVTNYVALAGTTHVPPVVACIGPVTAGTARRAGIEVTVVAGEHTIPGLVDALTAVLA
jgi:uroporphyrinogen III methyltransferase/synthase